MTGVSYRFLHSKYSGITFVKQHSFNTRFSVPTLPMYLLHVFTSCNSCIFTSCIYCLCILLPMPLRDINPDHIILHAGTNDLRTENTASQIAKATIDLATSLKNDDNTVTVSGIVPRLDDLDNKANEVNRRLVLMCKERNISFLSHDESVDPSKHLNESKLHLNNSGIKIFAENFSKFLVKLN